LHQPPRAPPPRLARHAPRSLQLFGQRPAGTSEGHARARQRCIPVPSECSISRPRTLQLGLELVTQRGRTGDGLPLLTSPLEKGGGLVGGGHRGQRLASAAGPEAEPIHVALERTVGEALRVAVAVLRPANGAGDRRGVGPRPAGWQRAPLAARAVEADRTDARSQHRVVVAGAGARRGHMHICDGRGAPSWRL
jgi:hypothetical protein